MISALHQLVVRFLTSAKSVSYFHRSYSVFNCLKLWLLFPIQAVDPINLVELPRGLSAKNDREIERADARDKMAGMLM